MTNYIVVQSYEYVFCISGATSGGIGGFDPLLKIFFKSQISSV